LLLMRHPQTVHNLEKRFQGQQNSPLSELGEQQCQAAVAGLLAWRPDTLVASPLLRCQAIAQPVAAALGLSLQIDPRLMEMSFGKLEGFSHAAVREMGYAFPWEADYHEKPAADIESVELFAARVQAAADQLLEHQGRVAAVTHGGVIRFIVAHFLRMPLENAWQMAVRNVESACFSVDNYGTIYLEAYGLKPEWLSSIE
jgi:broad specificity phosphatase PhoE